MSDVAIQARGLSKKYKLGGPSERYSTLRDQLRRWAALATWLRRADEARRRPLFWALKDVSFDVPAGEVVGIIGRNGAGKSTLLKILSRITEPTEGAATIFGRVGCLLEVGTGFHPELTGRENIFLNGAILGMRRTEVARKFAEIVAFAEVEQFVDTAVKHYSSGMYMRLAFSVAAHLEPEILIVDEVLAVGDAEFQKKCLGKMGEVAGSGRTVVFVSHNMQTVSLLCSQVIVLEKGEVSYQGGASGGIAQYYHDLSAESAGEVEAGRRPGTGAARITAASPAQKQFRPDEPKRFQFRARTLTTNLVSCHLTAHLVNELEQTICQFDSRFLGKSADFNGGSVQGELVIRHPWLKPGNYSLDLFLVHNSLGILDRYEKACQFQVLPILPFRSPAPESSISPSLVISDFDWELEPSRSNQSS